MRSRRAPTRGELLEGEEEMKDSVMLPHQVFAWQQRYTPQKPIFFNKVKSGYDWNQYNQTHYDLKDPPPKVIQGYSFNIFYPDLVDKTRQPSFVVEADKTDPNWCVIRFHAGAPYEDVAFRVRVTECGEAQIVNRQWDRGRKSRFRNDFERGVLHLYFDFKKYQINSSCDSLLEETAQLKLLYMRHSEALKELLSELSLEIGLIRIVADYASEKSRKRTVHVLVKDGGREYPRNRLLRSHA